MKALPNIVLDQNEIIFKLSNVPANLTYYSLTAIINWLSLKTGIKKVREDHGFIVLKDVNTYFIDNLYQKLAKDIEKDKVLNTLSYRIGINKVRFGTEWVSFSRLDMNLLQNEIYNEYKATQFFDDGDPSCFMYNRELDYIKRICSKDTK